MDSNRIEKHGKNANVEQIQKQHYDAITSQYTNHYGDAWSRKYRYRFINEPMCNNIDLSGANVVDAMCGSGEVTRYLLKKGARVTGVDISPEAIRYFQKRFSGCIGKCASILSSGLESNSYDCVVVGGALHHLHPNVLDGVKEIHRILKVGGYFCFMEPHEGSLPDQVRKLWYKHDNLNMENEAAINLTEIKSKFSSKFKFVKESYGGNIAYLLVFNSLMFRIPLRAKPIYSPLLIAIESMMEKTQGKLFSCFVVCQWKKVC